MWGHRGAAGRPAWAMLVLAVSASIALAACSRSAAASDPPSAPSSRPSLPPVIGASVDRAVPPLRFVDQNGRPTSLAAFRGRYVVLVPFLTLCGEHCPITTGALIEMHDAVQQAGLAGRVAFVEATIDPGRDTPARLHAYQRMAGLQWMTLLTGSAAEIRTAWTYFGVYYKKVPEGSPPNIDWWTHKPETYDIEHQDALYFLDPTGHERIVLVGMGNVQGHLGPWLKSLLDTQGRSVLAHPEQGSWTVAQALSDLGHLLGRPISTGGG